ncbi:formylglycine-generating enzyme family protein [Aurantiacibacter odishensis]|uniref:formylglycine-generating enzyme family protein n=1 Tax=Aurantiacibacter odishensis TaxID=1155476 RepID=UPI000E757E22|nr:formylglycine-generating enzyme family protein [Aurantiacibacter odishensis]
MDINKTIGLTALAACLAVAGCEGETDTTTAQSEQVARTCAAIGDTPVRLEGGTFAMGQAEVYAEEGPVRQTTVDGFWIDPHEVTNRQFAAFVEATDYVTLAEKPVDPAAFGVSEEQIPPELLLPGSAVFTPPERPSNRYSDWWKYVPGANWKRPYGPGGPEAQPDEPVVHLGWEDMQAYALWKGGRMPTEAEWEYAASAGQPATTEQPEEANSWQGVFPAVNRETDGFRGIAPVGCYAPNPNGLYDMVGNVWEVTADLFRPGHDPADTDNPRGPSENQAYDPLNPGFPSRVMKGGSYLCAPNYCQRYRPASRQGRDPGMGASNVGFRLAYDMPPA